MAKQKYYLVCISNNTAQTPHYINNRLKPAEDCANGWEAIDTLTFPLNDKFSFKNMTIGLDRLALVRHLQFHDIGSALKLVNDEELKRLMIGMALNSAKV